MATDGITGFGLTLTGGSVGAIGQIVSLDGPSIEVDDVEITSIASTNGWKEFIAGLKDAGEISGTLVYKEAEAETVIDAMGGAAEVWTLLFSDGSNFACSGYLKAQGTASPIEDRIEQTFSIKLSGEPTSKWEGS